MRNKASEVYLKAAKDIDAGRSGYSCISIDNYAGQRSQARSAYAHIYEIDSGMGQRITDNEITLWDKCSAEQRKTIRVLMLLLMSEIARSEE